MSSAAPLVVGFPLYQDVTLLDFAGATQMFAFAEGRFECLWIAHEIKPIKTTEGVQVLPNRTFDKAGPIDVLFVPGAGSKGIENGMFDPDYQDFLKAAGPEAQWCGSVCTGAFILAASGLLDGCQATTYWSQLENLKLLAPSRRIEVVAGYPRYLIDYKHCRFTGGGVSSSIDLALELIMLLTGLDVARKAQLSNQYAPNPPVNSGDPSQAPPEITEEVFNSNGQESFRKDVFNYVQRLLGC